MSESGADVPRGGLTYADYAALPDDGKRYQLVEGELVVTPSPSRWHQQIVIALAQALRAHVVDRDLGELNVAPRCVAGNDDDFCPALFPGFAFRLAPLGLPPVPPA